MIALVTSNLDLVHSINMCPDSMELLHENSIDFTGSEHPSKLLTYQNNTNYRCSLRKCSIFATIQKSTRNVKSPFKAHKSTSFVYLLNSFWAISFFQLSRVASFKLWINQLTHLHLRSLQKPAEYRIIQLEHLKRMFYAIKLPECYFPVMLRIRTKKTHQIQRNNKLCAETSEKSNNWDTLAEIQWRFFILFAKKRKFSHEQRWRSLYLALVLY